MFKAISKRVQNTAKFYNRPAKDIIKDVFNGYNDFPFSFREMLKHHGNEKVNSITIVRTPLSNVTNMLLNVVTFGELQNRMKNSPYDNMFHLKIIVNNKYTIEKNQVINFSDNNNISQNSDIQKVSNIPHNLSIGQMMDNTKNMMGKSMFSYNALYNNCQKFVSSILNSNNMNGYDHFILQDIQSIFEGLHNSRKVINTVTDIGNHTNKLFEGSGIDKKKKKTLTTLSNNDIVSICINLKLPPVNICMKDELHKGLKDGFYIMNLENHNQGGSHWIGWIKQASKIYYNDSFGVVMPQNEYDIFRSENDQVYYNTQQHQDLYATSCGWWAIAYLYHMNNSKGSMLQRFKTFNKLFGKNTKLNEKRLLELINKIM